MIIFPSWTASRDGNGRNCHIFELRKYNTCNFFNIVLMTITFTANFSFIRGYGVFNCFSLRAFSGDTRTNRFVAIRSHPVVNFNWFYSITS